MKVLIFQVVSYFYYKRAKVKGLMYKDKSYSQELAESTKEEFPTLNEEIIDMDFDTCVKKQYPECVFAPDSDGEMEHRTQMGQFCGHDEVNLKIPKKLWM